MIKEADEEDNRGENAAVRTPEHNEDGPSDMGAVNDMGVFGTCLYQGAFGHRGAPTEWR